MRFQLVRDLGRADRIIDKILGALNKIATGKLQVKGDKREMICFGGDAVE